MKTLRFAAALSFLLLTGCDMFAFEPYDYKKGSSARVRSRDSEYSFGIKNDHLLLRKKTDILSPVPKKKVPEEEK